MKNFIRDLFVSALITLAVLAIIGGISYACFTSYTETRITESRTGYLASVQRVVGANNSYFIVAVEFDGEVHYYDVAPDKVITKQSVGSRATVEIKDGTFIIFMPTTDKLI